MKIIQLESHSFASNCYLIVSGNECAVVDPSADESEIAAAAWSEGAQIKYILLTHAHFDHMLFLGETRELTGAMLAVHEYDTHALYDPDISLFSMLRRDTVFAEPELILKDEMLLPLCEENIRVLHTPGHTPGSVVYDCGGELITGDTLFDMSVGRTDFPGGDDAALRDSVKRLYVFPDSTAIYPGHGGTSTIGIQKHRNPYTNYR